MPKKDRIEKIQINTTEGTFEMHANGRPDGKESVLESYVRSIEEYHSTFGKEPDVLLSDRDVQELGEEAMLYRIRREHFFQREDFVRARRDIVHGIRLLEFITRHAENEETREFYRQFRPDQEVFKTLTESHLDMQRKDYASARRRVVRGMKFINGFYNQIADYSPEELRQAKLEYLDEIFKDIGQAWENDPGKLNNSPAPLEEQLEAAIEDEDYERAAQIRDLLIEQKNGN